jgi:SagB-type dehydrogenase family enzyme
MKRILLIVISISLTYLVTAQNIKLPQPRKTGGKPLMEVLAQRSSIRSLTAKELTMQQVSNLCWAAFGVNRDNGKRTAPSARNSQETDVYVLLKTGAYLYDAAKNELVKVASEDLRGATDSRQSYKDAPVTLLLIADLSRVKGGSDADKLNTANIDCGYISQNIYLFCASEGLGTCARGSVDKAGLGSKLKLKAEQTILLAHSVGYPKE